MSNRYFRIDIDDFTKDNNGDVVVHFSVVDTRNGKIVMTGERVVEVELEDEKDNIYREVWDVLSRYADILDGKEKLN